MKLTRPVGRHRIALAAQGAEQAEGHDERDQHLHHADAEVAQPALSPSDMPCIRLGKKKLMFDIDEAKLPPPMPESAASTRRPTAASRVAQRQADSQSRQNQQAGGQEDDVAPAGDADQEGARDPQRAPVRPAMPAG